MNISIEIPKIINDEIMSITKKDNVVDGIKDLVTHELIRKKNKYLFMVKNYEKKYGLKFKDFEKEKKNTKMDYETEKDYLDWDMAETVLDDIENEIKGVN